MICFIFISWDKSIPVAKSKRRVYKNRILLCWCVELGGYLSLIYIAIGVKMAPNVLIQLGVLSHAWLAFYDRFGLTHEPSLYIFPAIWALILKLQFHIGISGFILGHKAF